MKKKPEIKSINVQTLLKRFSNRVLHAGNIKKNIITNAALNRTGLELANRSSCKFNNINSCVVWGDGESRYLSSITEKERFDALKNVLKLKPPLIIICANFKHINTLQKISSRYPSTIVITDLSSSELNIVISGWINEQLATFKLIHGTVIFWNGIGVLIRGESGVGKSEVALQILKNNNAMLVGDDAIEISNIDGRVVCHASDVASEFLEVRGIGIVNVAKMFGVAKIKKSSRINMVVQLVKTETLRREYFERLGKEQKYIDILGVQLPVYNIPVTYGRDISNMIEVAIYDHKLKSEGYNSANDYMKNYNKILKKDK